MKKLIGIFLMLLCLSSYSQDINAANNFIKMSYATMSVSQTLSLSATEKAGGTFTLRVDAMDGGGRGPPNYSADIINLRIDYYNSAGTLLGYSLSNNSTNYYATTYSTYTLSSANCGSAGSCSQVATMKVSLFGNDGGYWAGNVGTNMTNPVLTFTPTGGTESSNLLYNPQWAVGLGGYAGNTGPVGWTNSTGAWGGNTHPQLYDAGASITLDITGGTVVQTRAPSSQTLTSGGGSSGPTTTQTTRIDNYNNSTKSHDNYLYIDQISGNNNTVNVTQSGGPNDATLTLNGAGTNTVNITQNGAGYLNATVNGYNNNLTTSQSNTSGSHYAETSITGNTNTVNHTQTGNASQLLFSTISGNSNTVNSTQTGNAQHYLNVTLTGNGNSVTADQSGNTSNSATINLTNNGGAAAVDLQQTGGKSFNLIQSCSNPSGCSTVVRQ